MRRGTPVAAGALILAAALTGCATAALPATTQTPTAAATATPEPTLTATPDAEGAIPTCEDLIPSSLVEQFTAQGWTSRADLFRVGELTLSDGVQCVWGDYSVASDHVLIFGWAAATAAEADQARASLLASGWRVADDASGSYITEDPATAIATDENGYGMTYQFGDGWITVADTKQGLLLIERPD